MDSAMRGNSRTEPKKFECEDCGRPVRWPSERVEMCGHTWCGPCATMRRYEQKLEDLEYYVEHQEEEEDW